LTGEESIGEEKGRILYSKRKGKCVFAFPKGGKDEASASRRNLVKKEKGGAHLFPRGAFPEKAPKEKSRS